MIRYPVLVLAMRDRDLGAVATAAGVPVDDLAGYLVDYVAPLAVRPGIAAALDVDVVDLFRLPPDLEDALDGAPSRYVTDPATLRIIDRPR